MPQKLTVGFSVLICTSHIAPTRTSKQCYNMSIRFDTVPATDRQTDRQTDEPTDRQW